MQTLVPYVAAILLRCGSTPLELRTFTEVNRLNEPDPVVFVSKSSCQDSIITVPIVNNYLGCSLERLCVPAKQEVK